MKNLFKYYKFENLKFWFVIMLVYITFINLFVIHSSPEILFFQYVFLVIVFITTRTKEFIKDWVFFIGFFMLYEFTRGILDDISLFKNITLLIIYNLEKVLFPKIPTIYLQEIFGKNQLLIQICFFFYTSFFYYSFTIAFIVWIKSRKLFRIYTRQFLILCLTGLVLFFLLPTAPPWLIEDNFHIGLERYLLKDTVVKDFSILTLYNYIFYGNPIAAFPSLHTAWPAFSSLFLIKYFKNKIYYLTLIVPIMIGFSVVFFGEHFLLDVFAGFLLAYFIVSKTSLA